MALIGNIEQYNPETDVNNYLERMQQFFIVNEVPANRKVPLFITLMGPVAYAVLKDLVSPAQTTDKTFEELKMSLQEYYSPKKLVITERYKFDKVRQEDMETISSFIIRLKNAATSCTFGNFLNEALRDRFVFGLKSSIIQQKLLSEDFTFENACKTAMMMEATQEQGKILRPENVNAVRRKVSKPCIWKNHKASRNINPECQTKSCPSTSAEVNPKFNQRCYRCGRMHSPVTCPARNWECFVCHKKGHTSKTCRLKQKSVAKVEEDEDIQVDNVINKLVCRSDPVYLNLVICKNNVKFELDTGSGITIISEKCYSQQFHNMKLETYSNNKVTTVSGEQLEVLGKINVKAYCNLKLVKLNIIVVKSDRDFTPLLGRDALDNLSPNWKSELLNSIESGKCKNVNVSQNSKTIAELSKEFRSVFTISPNEHIKKFKAHINLKEGTVPVFLRHYEIAYALKDKVEMELDNLVKMGILESVSYSEWASPIVVVPKIKTNQVRICADFKRTINPWIKVDQYPLPKIEDVFQAVAGGNCYCILDLSNAYLQMSVSEESRNLLTINTHRGLFRYKRLPFGIANAPALFQSMMDQILKGIPMCACYLDDVIVSGKSLAECRKNLLCVMFKLEEFNVKVNLQKCRFFESEVEYLGHELSSQGIRPLQSKVRAIQECPAPINLQQLRSYIGLLNYYHKFLPMLSVKLKPLYDLEKKNAKFIWSEECEQVFIESKNMLLKSPALIHYSHDKPIILTVDASPYGCGAVLSHLVNGVERPVMFMSSTFSQTEQNYSQLQREALAIIVAIKKFNKYLYGRHFVIYSDHQPLSFLFGDRFPIHLNSRLQRWAIFLSCYDYELRYKKGSLITNADALSRLPLLDGTNEEVNSMFSSESVPLASHDVIKNYKTDLSLLKVIEYSRKGWPNFTNVEESVKDYHKIKDELYVENDCLFRGNRLIIPRKMRNAVLSLLHEEHVGMVRMKMLARSHYYWSGIDYDIEKFVRNCPTCEIFQNKDHQVPGSGWNRSLKFWERVHIDFLQKFDKYFLIIVDSFSRYIDIYQVSSTNAKETVKKLRHIFSIFGLPDELVSDNGPPFIGEVYKNFCLSNGIKCTFSPPLHPRSNGTVEKQVHTVKQFLVKRYHEAQLTNSKFDIQFCIDNFLLKHRITPNSVTGICPAELIFKRLPKTKLDLLKPNYDTNRIAGNSKNNVVKENKFFIEGQKVIIYNRRKGRWEKGKIGKVLSKFTYLVITDAVVKFMHADDIKEDQTSNVMTEKNQKELPPNEMFPTYRKLTEVNPIPVRNPTIAPENPVLEPNEEQVPKEVDIPDLEIPTAVLRRSGRTIRAPERLNL